MAIHLGHRFPGGSSGVPGPSAGRVNGTCFALHRTGFGEPPCHHDRWWALTPPFHPYRRLSAGGLLSVPLSVGFRRLGFPQRPALRCPDFPRTPEAARGHPACTPNCKDVGVSASGASQCFAGMAALDALVVNAAGWSIFVVAVLIVAALALGVFRSR